MTAWMACLCRLSLRPALLAAVAGSCVLIGADLRAEDLPQTPSDDAAESGPDSDATPAAPLPAAAGAAKDAPKPLEKLAPAKPGMNDKAEEGPAEWSDSDDAGNGLFGKFRVGPTFALGIPHVSNYGIDVLWDERVGFAIATGKTSVTAFKPVEADISNVDFRVRWFPFRGSFFVGAAYGNQTISGKAAVDVTTEIAGAKRTVPTRFDVSAKTTYLTPHIGWNAMWDFGFLIGFELGAQIPMHHSTTVDVNVDSLGAAEQDELKSTKEYADQKQETLDALDKLASATLPYVTLLRVGWLF